MVRHIHSDNFHYKYAFAEEDSNLHTIAVDYKVGYHSGNEKDLFYRISRKQMTKLLKLKNTLTEKYGDTFEKAHKEKWYDENGKEKQSCSFYIMDKVNKKYNIEQEHWIYNLVNKVYAYCEKEFNNNKNKRFIYFTDEW
jgi:hypothetical protein